MNKRGGLLGVAIVVLAIFILTLIFFVIKDSKTIETTVETKTSTETIDVTDVEPVAHEPTVDIPNPKGFEREDQETQQMLLDLYAIDASSTAEDCENIVLKDPCYVKLADLKNDKSYCDLISNERDKEVCIN
jgi:hypothetical protein